MVKTLNKWNDDFASFQKWLPDPTAFTMSNPKNFCSLDCGARQFETAGRFQPIPAPALWRRGSKIHTLRFSFGDNGCRRAYVRRNIEGHYGENNLSVRIVRLRKNVPESAFVGLVKIAFEIDMRGNSFGDL